MTVKILNEAQKDTIERWYDQKILNQLELSQHFNVSERTINRVLEERGLATPVARLQGEAYKVMALLREYGLDYALLEECLSTPVITMEAVQRFLNRCSKEELAALFYTSGLYKLAETVHHAREKKNATADQS